MQGWNFCIFRDPGSEPKKIKEPKKLEVKRGERGEKKERGGEGKEGVKQTVLWLPRFTNFFEPHKSLIY